MSICGYGFLHPNLGKIVHTFESKMANNSCLAGADIENTSRIHVHFLLAYHAKTMQMSLPWLENH